MNGLTGIVLAALLTGAGTLMSMNWLKTIEISEAISALQAQMTIVLNYVRPDGDFPSE